MKGTIEDSIEYCSKSDTKAGDYVTNHVSKKRKIDMSMDDDYCIKFDDLFPWGQSLVTMVDDMLPGKLDRRIFWIWSQSGQMKKTETARYLCHHHHGCVIQGGRKHILATAYQCSAPIYILTIPRTDEGFVSYASIELLKDNLYMSGFGVKATGMVNRKKPWVIIMANFPPDCPDTSSLSEHRRSVGCTQR